MYRLLSLAVLLFLVNADPRSPKIYNVLISTKKNLSPSHALPVYEPVLRTTSLGIALPPFFYQPVTFVGPSQTGIVPPQISPNQELNYENIYPTNPEVVPEKPEDPKNVIANLKKNSNIPDVPPPALPTRKL